MKEVAARYTQQADRFRVLFEHSSDAHFIFDETEITRVEAELRKRTEDLEAVNRELAATNARLKRDLQAAARVQQALLPAALPDTPPVRLAWAFRPCEELAGDLLNIFLLDELHV